MESDRPSFDADRFLATLTHAPGVYRMLDERGRVLYVGKARDLRRRVSSYFRAAEQLAPKTRALMSHTRSVEVTATHTETEALLLENNLIKEYRPRYNVLLRDDKSFPYIHVSTDQAFPRFAFHRGPRNAAGRYFGPFASAGATRETLNLLQKLFQVRQCEDSYFRNRSRPCLQHQIQRCAAPCVGLVGPEAYADDVRHATMFLEGKSDEMIAELAGRMETAAGRLDYEAAARYRDQINSLRRVQARQYVSGARGDIDIVAALARDGLALVQLMMIRAGQSLGSRTILARHAAAAEAPEVLRAFVLQHYLAAAREGTLPDEILVSEPLDDLELLQSVLVEQSGRKVELRHRVRGDRARWLQITSENADLAIAQRLADRSNLRARFEALQDALGLAEAPARIECFDVSHTGGEATVASCVVFEADGPVKSDYRRFNIRDVEPGDDYAAMHQALTRRYTRVRREEGRLPDLLLVDGGRGQLGQAREVLAELGLGDLMVVGVAKGTTRKPGLETLFRLDDPTPVVLDPSSPALHLIQQVRDEAHRFAITGHRARRARARKGSVLEHVPGVGSKRRQRLLTAFGGLQGVSRAGVEDLARVDGISKTLAQAIYDAFRDAS
ncbi:MAG: excinuclease ABC subunit UvrC [Ectothiorhodospiraceae bacterium]|nr:excinuclease ABC subunit UvrC [Ectothiorhodospiraceae bacterium]